MRKTLFVLSMLLLFVLTGCGGKEPLSTDSDSTESVFVVGLTENEMASVPTEQTSEAEENHDTQPSLPQTNDITEPASPQVNTDIKKQTESVKNPITAETSESTMPSATEPDKTTATEPEAPFPDNATSEDSAEIAQLVIKYINEYRTEQGVSAAVSLSGLTEYAEYRSRQIISDFSHNTRDERAAATALKYGEYIDPALYGMSGEPYYTAGAGEAIAKAGYVGTPDYVASSLARLIRNSDKHWCYIGSAEYQYIGVGITYESGMWYCDVAMTRENQG